MRGLTLKNLFGIVVVGLLMVFGMSSNALGQGRGRGGSHMDKKCEKFVNCHDARDGRWDGRGPRRNVNWSNTGFWRHRRHRDRDWEDMNHRRRHRDRDRTDDRNWRRRNR
jgi:hypothetical protein